MAIRHIGLFTLAAITLTACSTRRPATSLPEAPRTIIPIWKLETGDIITTKVYREPDLSTQTTVGQTGDAYFPGLGRVPVAGMTMEVLQQDLGVRYNKLVIDAAVDAVMLREVVVVGQVRAPGVYSVDPSLTVLGLVARAGGVLGTGAAPILTLVKGDGRKFRITREERLSTLDIVHGDAIYVQDETWFGRNSSSLGSFSLITTLILSVATLLILFLK